MIKEDKLKLWMKEIEDCILEDSISGGLRKKRVVVICASGILFRPEPKNRFDLITTTRVKEQQILYNAHLVFFLDSGFIWKNKLTDGKNFSLKSNSPNLNELSCGIPFRTEIKDLVKK